MQGAPRIPPSRGFTGYMRFTWADGFWREGMNQGSGPGAKVHERRTRYRLFRGARMRCMRSRSVVGGPRSISRRRNVLLGGEHSSR